MMYCETHRDGRFEWVKSRGDIIMDHCDRWFIEDDGCAIVEMVEKVEYDAALEHRNYLQSEYELLLQKIVPQPRPKPSPVGNNTDWVGR